MSLLQCENMTFAYEGKKVLSEINFSVERGDYLCIVGKNGAGKTTLMKGILGLKPPAQGRIITGDGLEAGHIGYLPQQTEVSRDFPASVFEVVLSGRLNSIGWRPYYRKADKEIARRQMELLKIDNLQMNSYRELSGGQQQRVLLARALCAGQELLVLDEPVAGLDPDMTTDLYRIILRLNREEKKTIIMVSHDLSGVISYASHILLVDKTQLFFGTKTDYVNSSYYSDTREEESDVTNH